MSEASVASTAVVVVAAASEAGLAAAVIAAVVSLADILARFTDSVHDTMRAALLKSLVAGDTYDAAAEWALEAAKAYDDGY